MASTNSARSGSRRRRIVVIAGIVIAVVAASGVVVMIRARSNVNPVIRPGDREATLAFLSEQGGVVELVNSAETGRTYARADRAAGVHRILYFGVPWSAGKPLVDEQTGYDVDVVAGCAVSRDLVDFVEAYNTSMRSTAVKVTD